MPDMWSRIRRLFAGYSPVNRKDYLDHILFSEFYIQRRVIVTTFSPSALAVLVNGTEYIATVHARLIQKMVGVWPLEIRPLPFDVPPLTQCIQWHDYRSQEHGLLLASKIIRRVCYSHGSGSPALIG
ncbi:MAG: hypothetical protein AB8B64_05600 [Granulosicoccus sp.]